MVYRCYSAFIGGCLIAAASEPLRTWRTQSGGQMEATWNPSLDTDGNEIRLLKDGKKYKIQLDKLVDDDQRYIEQRRKELAAAAENPASNFEYTKSGGEITITRLNNKEMVGEVAIPRTIDGSP